MEHGCSTDNKEDTDSAATAKAKLERDAIAKDLEEETKRAIETAGRAVIKEKMESSKSFAFLRLWSR